MTTYRISAPDGNTYQIDGPAGASQDEVVAEVLRQHPTAGSKSAEKPASIDTFAKGLDFAKRTANQMFPLAFPAGEALANLASGTVAAPVSGLAGIAGAPFGANTAARNVETVGNALTYRPSTPGGQLLTRVATAPMQAMSKAGDVSGDIVNAPDSEKPQLSPMAANYGLDPFQVRARSPESRAADAALVNTAIQGLPALFLRGRAKSGELGGDVTRAPSVGPGSAAREGAAPGQAATSAQRPAGLAQVPSKADLKSAADAAYKRADEAGVVVTPASFNSLKSKISDQMQRDGIDPTLHPDSTAALKRIMDKDGALSLQELETLRRIANDAEGSIKPADRRLAGKMVDEIDDYIDSLSEHDVVSGDATKAKALKEARNFYSRAKKAEELDNLVARAELSAPNFSASGMENALRTEFRALAKNDRRLRRFTKEEQEAIRKVAKGGPMENTLRMLGKLAPTGVVSGALSSGAGFVTGGPVGAVALPALGAGARYAATQMTLRNAALANELVRRGPLAPSPSPFSQLGAPGPQSGILGTEIDLPNLPP